MTNKEGVRLLLNMTKLQNRLVKSEFLDQQIEKLINEMLTVKEEPLREDWHQILVKNSIHIVEWTKEFKQTLDDLKSLIADIDTEDSRISEEVKRLKESVNKALKSGKEKVELATASSTGILQELLEDAAYEILKAANPPPLE
jgi:hypothetical protein